MSESGVRELLIRAALDVDFRRQILSDPEATFAEYALSDEQREILRSADERMHDLLGAAVRAGLSSQNESRSSESTAAAEENPKGEPPPVDSEAGDARLLLQVVPDVRQEEGGVRIAYTASLHALPEGTDPESVPIPDEAAQGSGLPPLRMVVQVTPTIHTGDDRQTRIAFSASLKTLFDSDAPRARSGDSPWNHQTESRAARQAAEAVRAASPEDRFDRLLALAQALEIGDADD